MTCPDCGAAIAIDIARCPFCGALNPVGAEKAYMEALDDIKDDTGDLVEDERSKLKASLKASTKRTIAVVAVVFALVAGLFLAASQLDKGDQQRELQEYQARESFRTQYFEEFDRLYEAGDDDTLSEYMWNLMDDPGFDALYSWPHAPYLEVHDGWEALQYAASEFEAGNGGIDDYTWAVMMAFDLVQLDADNQALTPEEEERAAGYRAYAWEFLQETLKMSREEVVAFADQAKDEEGYIQTGRLKPALEARLKRIGTLG